MTTTSDCTTVQKAIVYNYANHDYDCYLIIEGAHELIGSTTTYHDGEVVCDAAYQQLLADNQIPSEVPPHNEAQYWIEALQTTDVTYYQEYSEETNTTATVYQYGTALLFIEAHGGSMLVIAGHDIVDISPEETHDSIVLLSDPRVREAIKASFCPC